MNSAKDRILKLVVEQAQLLGLLIEPSWDEDYSGGGSPEDVLVLNVIKKKHLIRFQKAELLRCDAGDEQVCDSIRALVYEELKELKGEVARPSQHALTSEILSPGRRYRIAAGRRLTSR